MTDVSVYKVSMNIQSWISKIDVDFNVGGTWLRVTFEVKLDSSKSLFENSDHCAHEALRLIGLIGKEGSNVKIGPC